MALEDFKAELDKLNRDLVVLTARRNEFRPDVSKDVEEHFGGVWSKKKFRERAEREAPDVLLYNKWKLKTIVDTHFHVVARLCLIPNERLISSFKDRLIEGMELSLETPKRGFVKSIAGWFGARKRTLDGVNSDLKILRDEAERHIGMFVAELSEELRIKS